MTNNCSLAQQLAGDSLRQSGMSASHGEGVRSALFVKSPHRVSASSSTFTRVYKSRGQREVFAVAMTPCKTWVLVFFSTGLT